MSSQHFAKNMQLVTNYQYGEIFLLHCCYLRVFVRFSELAGLTIKDIAISDSHLTLQVTRSKTYQYRKGDEVVIARSGKVTRPVVNLEKYMSLANIDTSKAGSDYLFKPLVKVGSGFKLIEKVKPLSYNRARESIVGLLKEFVPDSANISLHSFSAGGCYCRSQRPGF